MGLIVLGSELSPGYSCSPTRERDLLGTQEILCTSLHRQREVPTWCNGSQRSHSSLNQGKPGTWRRGPAYSKWLDDEVGVRGEFLGFRVYNSEYNTHTSSQSVSSRLTVEMGGEPYEGELSRTVRGAAWGNGSRG